MRKMTMKSNKSIWYRGKEYRQVPGRRYSNDRNQTLELWITKRGEFLVLRSIPVYQDRKGYWSCRFKERGFYTHRAVLMAWQRLPKEGEVAMHLDGNHQHNHLRNLRWGTQKENQQMMIRHGTSARGVRNGHARLTASDVVKIRRQIKFKTLVQLAAEYQVAATTIHAVATGRNWGWLPGAVKRLPRTRLSS